MSETMDKKTPLILRGLPVSDGICIGKAVLTTEETNSVKGESFVLITHELGLNASALLSGTDISAVVTSSGSPTSHGAIIARALGIPSVVGIQDFHRYITSGETVIVDGSEGEVIIAPDNKMLEEYREKQKLMARFMDASEKLLGSATKLKDDRPIKLMVNMDVRDRSSDMVRDSEGVGLVRAESLFENRMDPPSEDDQYEVYKGVMDEMAGKPVNFRLLDAGGDKIIPYLNTITERNPFMGTRGIRFLLDRKDILKTQLKALMRAGTSADLRILAPVVTRAEELMRVKAIMYECADELTSEGKEFRHPLRFGSMIETPAAALASDIILQHTDFAYMGTNDLSAYVMCADRTNSSVASYNSCYEPAVIRAIIRISTEARKLGVPLGICGEVAYSTELIPLFIALDLDNFSIPPRKLLSTRYLLSSWSRQEAIEVTKHVLELNGASDIKKYLEDEAKRRLP